MYHVLLSDSGFRAQGSRIHVLLVVCGLCICVASVLVFRNYLNCTNCKLPGYELQAAKT